MPFIKYVFALSIVAVVGCKMPISKSNNDCCYDKPHLRSAQFHIWERYDTAQSAYCVYRADEKDDQGLVALDTLALFHYLDPQQGRLLVDGSFYFEAGALPYTQLLARYTNFIDSLAGNVAGYSVRGVYRMGKVADSWDVLLEGKLSRSYHFDANGHVDTIRYYLPHDAPLLTKMEVFQHQQLRQRYQYNPVEGQIYMVDQYLAGRLRNREVRYYNAKDKQHNASRFYSFDEQEDLHGPQYSTLADTLWVDKGRWVQWHLQTDQVTIAVAGGNGTIVLEKGYLFGLLALANAEYAPAAMPHNSFARVPRTDGLWTGTLYVENGGLKLGVYPLFFNSDGTQQIPYWLTVEPDTVRLAPQ